ncbi:MAG: response regulator transcription factor [Candidatus Aminicenantes bacterium]|nr:response regulator transcription factor [Candidatus Aminicenantes bacterium]
MNELVAIIEDEADLAALTAEHLRREGFRVETFGEAERFFRSLAKKRPDLIVLDLMLPDMSGLDVCRTLKQSDDWRSIPIIMATARAEETDRVIGLELGADDYVVKPFSHKELAARIKAVLRRSGAPEEGRPLAVGKDLVLDSERFEARWKGALVDLTSTEFRILHLLASKKGRVLTREQILDELWGHEKIVLDRTVDVHIKNLRDKLGPAAFVVKNIRGVGYKVEP